ncbi:TPA: hypothetical protein ACF2C8_001725 [Clostridium perfringens]
MKGMKKEVKHFLEIKGEEGVDIDAFLKIEGFLNFCYKNDYKNDVKNIWNLPLNLHKIGKNNLSKVHYELDIVRTLYYEISSRSYYEKLLDIYESINLECRLYYIKDNRILENEKSIFKREERKKYYEELFNEKKKRVNNIKYDNELIEYTFKLDGADINVDFRNLDLEPIIFEKERDKKGGAFECSLEELFSAAREIDKIIEEKIKSGETSIRIENFEYRMKKSTIMAFKDKKVSKTKKIKISEVCNILGMVGAGKSTMMVVVSYLAAKRGYRICIVLESTKEVFDLNNLLNILEIKSTAIKGKSTILDQIDKVTEENYMYMDNKYAKELTGTCILDGVINRLDNIKTIPYGKEPCFSLKYGENTCSYLCPAYGICPRKESERKIATADVVVSNIYSMVYGKTHYSNKFGRISFVEYIIDNFDIVIFDEADKVQVALDKIFCEKTSIKEVLSNNKRPIEVIIGNSINGNINSNHMDIIGEYYKILAYLCSIRDFINTKNIVSNIERIRGKRWFSALILLKESKDIDYIISNEIEKYISMDYESQIINSYILNKDKFRINLNKKYFIYKNQVTKVEFIINLVLFEKSIIKFGSMIQEQVSRENIDFDIPNIFRAPFKNIRKLIPTSPVGNRFGYIYDDEEKDIVIFRQYGVGRSLMIDLPNMKLNKDGKGLGPNVVLFSGSSWAEGSFRYHISQPVSYVLKSDDKIIEFIEKTNCIKINSRTKVSGGKNKEKLIENLIEESKQYIENEINNNGTLLMIVNSYSQCLVAQNKLSNLFPNKKILRLISDKNRDGEGTVKKGELRSLYKENIRILIAPAMAIERGHNIVDEKGHSIFDSIFFLVRPMDAPRDIENIISIINGAIVEKSIKEQRKKIYNSNKDIINMAYGLWERMFRSYYSVANVDELVKKEIVVSRLVLIIQIFGRLLRIVDYNKPIPKIYFADGAFGGEELDGFNLLNEICIYLEENINRSDVGELVKLLYGPFYNALKGGFLSV